MTFKDVEKEIDMVEQELADAVTQHDAAALDRMIADDFVIVGETLGEKLGDKKLYVGDCLGAGPIESGSGSYDRVKLSVYRDTAIVNSIFKYQITIAGKEYRESFFSTRVWFKNGEQWQLVSCHSHRLAETAA